MPRLNLRRYDVQARVSVVLSCASILCVAAMAACIANAHIDWEYYLIRYRPGGPRWLAVMASAGLATLLSLSGLSLGANSAGQRRNDKQRHSWVGFFVGVISLTITLLLLTLFLLRAEVAK